MKKLLTRVICFSLISIMIFSLAGCSKVKDLLNGNFGENGGDDNLIADAKDTDALKNVIYKDVKEIDLGWENVNSIHYLDGKTFAYSIKYDSTQADEYWEGFDWEEFEANGSNWEEYDAYAANAPKTYYYIQAAILSPDGTVEKEMEYEVPENMYPGQFCTASADTFYCTFSNYDNNSGEEKIYLGKYDFSGKEIFSKELGKPQGVDYFYVSYMTVDKNGNLLVSGGDKHILIYDANGNKTGEYSISMEDAYINGLVKNKDGVVYLAVYDYTNNKSMVNEFDSTTKTLGAEVELPELWNCGAYGGMYDLYYKKSDGTFTGYNVADEKSTPIFSPFDSDLDTNSFGNMIQSDETHILAIISDGENVMYDSGEGTQKIHLFEKVPPEQVADKEIITIGCIYFSYDINKQILNYNKNSDKYKIRTVNYDDFNTLDDYTLAQKQFNNDIVTGKAPDIIILPSNMNIRSYINKNVFLDLNEFFDKDTSVKKEDYNQNILNLCTSDKGELFALIPSFTISTTMVKKSVAGDGIRSIEELKEVEKKAGVSAFNKNEMTRDGILNMFFGASYDAFMDIETGKCDFTNPEFIALLEYAKEYPEEIDYDSLNNDSDYWNNYQARFRNNQVLMEGFYLSDFQNFNYQEKGTVGEEILLNGYPVAGSSGAYISPDYQIAISKKTKYADEAWNFIKYFLSDDYVTNNEWAIPLSNKALEEKVAKSKKKPYYTNEDGTTEEYDQTFWINDQEIIIPPLTDAEAQRIVDYINSVDKIYFLDESIMDIVKEEAAPFFSGQKSAEEVAKVIQSRVQVYVNENK
ncbi:MAG: hypothetical protein PUE21_04920 [Lachnospiraceae bacterium]|nr:hypothetical protein [Lachnospiraceae bacterium]